MALKDGMAGGEAHGAAFPQNELKYNFPTCTRRSTVTKRQSRRTAATSATTRRA